MKNFVYGVLFSVVCVLGFYGIRDVLQTYDKAERFEKMYEQVNKEHRELLESLPDEYCQNQKEFERSFDEYKIKREVVCQLRAKN